MERSTRVARRVRGPLRESEPVERPPHPDLLPARGEKELAEDVASPNQTTK
jgi:hypothetical protein